MAVLTVSAVKDQSVSDDGSQATVKFTTKYMGDLDVTMPIACVEELMTALQKLQIIDRAQGSQNRDAAESHGAQNLAASAYPTPRFGLMVKPADRQPLFAAFRSAVTHCRYGKKDECKS